MLSKFLKHKKENSLFQTTDNLLLAVSGGIDSMVMVSLFKEAGLPFGIAHCNFQLRGADSEKDEALVKTTAQKLQVPFHTIRFDTKAAAKHYDSSIQLVARDLRYQWLEDIRDNHSYQYIATAHHLNDSLETVLYNLSKGCGIRGLHGIPVKNGLIIRPLLFANRQEIETYATKKNISYREDASNASTKYNRNLIRHEVIPQLEKINPSLLQTFARTLQQLQDSEFLFKETIERYRVALIITKGPYIHINTTPLLNHAARSTILYELLLPYGFNSTQIEQLLLEQTQVGAVCKSGKYDLLKDRNKWIIRVKNNKKENYELVKKNIKLVIVGKKKISFHLSNTQPASFPSSPSIAYLDQQLLTYPLIIRAWQTGDRFQPLGMGGKHKKIQDFLSNLKLHRFEKEEVLVLESKGEIAWVVGYRLDERFKITAQTEKILKVEYGQVYPSG